MSTNFKYYIERIITFPDTIVVLNDGCVNSFPNVLRQAEGVYYTLEAAKAQMEVLAEIEKSYDLRNMKHILTELEV